MLGKLVIAAGDRAAATHVLGLKLDAIGGEDELRLLRCRLGALPQGAERRIHLAGRTGGDMDVAALEDGAGDV